MSRADTSCVIALAGNPNVGKSTLFNRITGLRQHTGNWPGKTVEIAQGTAKADGSVRVVDLPGAYSLMAHSKEEEVARDFLLFERVDVPRAQSEPRLAGAGNGQALCGVRQFAG